MNSILFYGIGNPSREDDGIGVAFIDMLDKWLKEENIEGIKTEVNYQLNIEDAELISKYDIVFFVDAVKVLDESFQLEEIEPMPGSHFTTHVLTPENILHLSNELYNSNVKAYALKILGYSWNYNEKLSPKATENLDKAFLFVTNKIKKEKGIFNSEL